MVIELNIFTAKKDESADPQPKVADKDEESKPEVQNAANGGNDSA